MKPTEKYGQLLDKLSEWSDDNFLPAIDRWHDSYEDRTWKQRLVVWMKTLTALTAVSFAGITLGAAGWGILTFLWQISPAIILIPLLITAAAIILATWIK